MVAAPMTVLVADDEQPALDELVFLLGHDPRVGLIHCASNGADALRILTQEPIDAVFLDIHMPGLSGIDLARALGHFDRRPPFVFVTADEERAVEAFDLAAVDYVLKPVQAERLAQTVQRLQERLAARSAAPALDGLVEQLAARLKPGGDGAPREPLRWVSASVGDTIKLFGIDEVLFFQSDEKYTRVVTASDEAHIRKPLKEILEGLDPQAWWQIHRGAVVRAAAVQRAQRDELGRITLHLRNHAEKLAVSQAWAWRFKPM